MGKTMRCTVKDDNQFYILGENRALKKGYTYMVESRSDIGCVYKEDVERAIGKKFGSWMGPSRLQDNSHWIVEAI